MPRRYLSLEWHARRRGRPHQRNVFRRQAIGGVDEVARWTAFESIAVILDSSQRADRLIQQALQDFRMEIIENGKPVPIEFYFMEKKRGEPALEVADFVTHAVGRQARHNLKKRGDFVPDFRAVFHRVDRKLTSFIELSSVQFNKTIDS
jgi:hypothetical protein